jgi:hypothetical protein
LNGEIEPTEYLLVEIPLCTALLVRFLARNANRAKARLRDKMSDQLGG